MGLFSKKKATVNYNELFKEKYKEVNRLTQSANNEIDFVIKESLWANVVSQYEELLEYIDKGADYDRHHFEGLLDHAKAEYNKVKGINEDA